MTGYSNWDIIINIADYVSIIWPVAQDNFISSIEYCGSDICFAIVECKFPIFLDYI